MPIKVSLPRTGSDGQPLSLRPGSKLLDVFPNLLEWLCCLSPEGALARPPGSIQIFVEGGKWKARLKDKAERAYCFVSGESLDGLLESVNDGLGDGTLDWRPDNDGPPKAGRRSN